MRGAVVEPRPLAPLAGMITTTLPASRLVDSESRSNPEVVGSIPTEVKRFFLYFVWFPDSLY